MSSKCPKCGAPAGPSAPDGDFRYRPPSAPNNTQALSNAQEQIRELCGELELIYVSHNNQAERIAELEEALQGLLSDIEEYQTINHLGGENNHWQIAARKALATETTGE